MIHVLHERHMCFLKKPFPGRKGFTSDILAHRRGFGSGVALFWGPQKSSQVTPPSKMAGVQDGQEF